MKKIRVLSLFLPFILFGCASVGLTPQQKTELASKIENQTYKFIPQSANPMGGKTINLSGGFSLKITKDTIDSYLPYYGRAYSVNPMEGGGIKFLTKDFNYNLTKKKEGVWEAIIVTKDTQTQYKLCLKLSDSGYASLSVEDPNRQSISFYGTIE